MKERKQRDYSKMEAWSSFRIETEKTGEEYRKFVIDLFNEYLYWLFPDLDHKFDIDPQYYIWNQESRTPVLKALSDGSLFDCKLNFYDDDGPIQRSVVFRDHNHPQCLKIQTLKIADTFEDYLLEKEIKFERGYR